MTRRLTSNTFTLLISNAGSAALSFVLFALIGRALGQEGLGVYAAALAWVFPVSLLADFGVNTLITRDAAEDPSSARAYLHAAVKSRLTLGGGCMLALIFGALLLSDNPVVVQGIIVSAPLVIVLPFFGAFTALLRAQQRMRPIAALNLSMLLAQAALTALILLAGGAVIAALVINTVTSAGQLAAAWLVWRWAAPRRAGSDMPRLPLVDLLRRAWPFALAGLLAALQLRIGVILLERLSSASEAGYFTAGSRFLDAGRMIPNAFFGALFPALSALSAQPDRLAQTLRRMMISLAGYAFVLAVLGIPFAALILALTFGANFAAAAPALQIAVWSLLPGLLRVGLTLYWYALKREQYVNKMTLLTLGLQILLGFWLIPLAGAAGAALVLLITEAVGFLLLIPLRGKALLEAR